MSVTDADPPGATAETSSGVSTVSLNIKLPPFWPSDPEVWFAQVDAHFTTRRVTSQKAKFDYVIASLTPAVATEVRDLILRPPSDHPYDTLREQLTRRTAASEQRKLQQLFTSEELGDRKPTQLLRRMQQLLGDRPGIADGSFLRELFLQRLPANVRMVLASTPDTTSLEDLAELADKIVEVATPAIAAVATSSLTTEVEHLRKEVTRLQQQLESLTTRGRPRSRSHTSPHRSHTPPARTFSPAPAPSPTESSLCWYHRKYGDQAHKCRPPCSKASNGQAPR